MLTGALALAILLVALASIGTIVPRVRPGSRHGLTLVGASGSDAGLTVGSLPAAGSSGVPRLPTTTTASTTTTATSAPPPAPSPVRVSVVHYSPRSDGYDEMQLNYVDGSPSGLRPAVLFVHGGAWVGGTRHVWDDPATQLAQANPSWVVANMEYRSSSSQRYIDEPADLDGALAWLQTQTGSTSLKIDPTRIALVGESAGGHLAILHALRPGDASAPRPKLVVSWSAPGDLAELARQAGCGNIKCDTDQHPAGGGAQAFVGGCTVDPPVQVNRPPACPNRYADGSPDNQADDGDRATSFLILQAAGDNIVPPSQATNLQAALDSHAIPNTLTWLPSPCHGAQAKGFVTDTGKGCNDQAWDPTVAFLRSHL
ncbi:MAG: hypothetical protein QOG03_805 [Actinomycetota bacterium]|nr:hypothetical protein [Actinomycetota bacterium]